MERLVNHPEREFLQSLNDQYPDRKYRRILMTSSKQKGDVQFHDNEVIHLPYNVKW